MRFRSNWSSRDLRGEDSSDHSDRCASCRAVLDALDGVEVLVRASRAADLPDGFAAAAARAATTHPQKSDSIVERLIPLAVPAAAASVVCALALLLVVGWTPRRDLNPGELIDPVASATEAPDLGEPEQFALGMDE